MSIDTTDTLSERDFERISAVIHRHCGINLHDGKKELVRARIAKRLRLTGMKSFGQYVDFALADLNGAEFTTLVDSLSTNLTSFFRENQHFAFLSDRFLPELIARKHKQNDNSIRAWSAGCSSGEEPYTIAMTLSEALGNAPRWDIRLLATDISTQVLAKATAGVYDKARVDSVPPALRGKYFAPRALNGQTMLAVVPKLRGMITFKYLNLMDPWPFHGPFDFIFCRNVMIYFDKPTQARLVQRYHDVLAPGGILFTGHSESLTGINHQFRFVQATIYRKA
jgi:chemotaxis protein methyltransferase CheR